MAITLTSLAAPTGVAASAGAGGSIPTGTYYVIVVAYNYAQTTADNEDNASRVKSPISSEVSVVLSTGNRTINVSWNAVSGASSYKVYITTVAPGDITRWSAKGVKNVNGTTSTVSPTTNGTSISLTDITNMNKPGTDWICYPYALPTGLDKTAGASILTISGTAGTVTIDNIVAALPVGQYVYDSQKQRLVLLASIVISASTTGSLDLSGKTIDFLHCSYANNSGGTFASTIYNGFWNLVGYYGSMELNVGDSVRNSAFKMGNTSAGYIVDSANHTIHADKRLWLRKYTDGGGNWFNGLEFGVRDGSKANISCIGTLFVLSADTTNYEINGLKATENTGGDTHIEYSYWGTNSYRISFRECNLGTTTGSSSGYHIYIGPTDAVNHWKFYDNVYRYVTDGLPIIWWAKSGTTYDATYNTADIYRSFALVVSDESNNKLENVLCYLENALGVSDSGLTSSVGIKSFGDVLVASMQSATPGTAGKTSTITHRNPFTIILVKYGYVPISLPISISKPLSESSYTLYASPFIVASEVTAAAMTGIAFDGTAKTATITEEHTLREITDHALWWKCQAANIMHDLPISTTDDISFTLATDWSIIIDGVTVSAAGKTVTASGTGTYSIINSGDFTGILRDDTNSRVPIITVGIVDGSRIQLYDVDDATELVNEVVSGTSHTYYFTYTADHEIRLRLTFFDGVTAQKWFTLSGDVTANGLTFNAVQVDDTVYNSVNIDGSTVTECSITGTTISIFIDDPDNTTQAQRIYNWYCYYLNTEDGIREQDGDYITAIDNTHYVFDNSMKIVNDDLSNPLEITGANITPVSGNAGNIFDVSNGASIILNFNRVEGFAYTSVGGLLADERNKLMYLVSEKKDINNVIAGL